MCFSDVSRIYLRDVGREAITSIPEVVAIARMNIL